MRSLITTLILAYLVYNQCAAQQPEPVSGTVVAAESGEPVGGATVKGLPSGETAITDQHGRFILRNIDGERRLQVTSVGYDTLSVEMTPAVPRPLVIRLTRSLRQLEEVTVSTGYGDLPMERVTGSYQKVDNALLNRSVSADLLSRLENVTTGIHFDKGNTSFNTFGRRADHNVYIHGISTLRNATGGGNAPLIVLDNFPYEGDINNINPNDIESVTVLMDAAASSIWGARAGNGVIVITSKRAKYGQPLSVRFNSNLAVAAKPDLFAHRTVRSADLIAAEQYLFEQGFFNSRENSRSKPALPPAVEIMIRQRDGELTAAEAQRQLDMLAGNDVREDMLRYMYRQAVQQQYALNISGGGERNGFVVGLGYDRSLPIRVSDRSSRITARLENNFKPWENLEIQAGVQWSNTEEVTTPGSEYYSDRGYRFPYVRLADEHGNALPIPRDYRMGFVDTAGSGALLDWHFRPLDLVRNPPNTDRADNLLLQGGATYRFLKDFEVSVKYQYMCNSGTATTHHDIGSYYARNLINRGTEIVDGAVYYHFPYGGILQQRRQLTNTQNGRAQLNYDKAWGGAHEVHALVGGEIRQSLYRSDGSITYGFDEDRLTYNNAVDHIGQFPVFGGLASFGTVPYPILERQETLNRFVSAYANASYMYGKRYAVSASARRDASNLFGMNANNRWTPLWSVGLAYTVDREHGYSLDWLPGLKLRATYGESGNVDNSLSPLVTIGYTSNPSSVGVPLPAAFANKLPNPELRWERVRQLNLGVDFSVFRERRLSGSVDVYFKRTKDLLHDYPIDPTMGNSTMVMNVANTKSRGVDLRLNSRNLQGEMQWHTDLLLSYNNNWITQTYVDYAGPSYYVVTGRISQAPGTVAFPAYSYRWGGLNPETGQPMGYMNGERSDDYRAIMNRNNTPLDDLIFHGSARPLYFGSLRNTWTYRGVSLSANIAYQLGFYFRRPGLDYQRLANEGDVHEEFYRRWQKPGDETTTDVPSFIYPLNANANTFYQHSEVLMEKGDYIRLQDIRLSYAIPGLNGIGISNANVYCYVNNVGILWRANKKGLDPAVGGNIPNPRSMAFGITFNL